MKFTPLPARLRRSAPTWLLVSFAWLALARAADAPDASEFKTIDRTNFSLKIPTAWHEGTEDADYKADTYFTVKAPEKKETYIQFSIAGKADDTQKLLESFRADLDGPAITTLSSSKLTEWGSHKGVGVSLKGKILDIAPGGIKLFVFNSDNHNVLVIEYYYSSELKDLQADLDYISQNLVMKN